MRGYTGSVACPLHACVLVYIHIAGTRVYTSTRRNVGTGAPTSSTSSQAPKVIKKRWHVTYVASVQVLSAAINVVAVAHKTARRQSRSIVIRRLIFPKTVEKDDLDKQAKVLKVLLTAAGT